MNFVPIHFAFHANLSTSGDPLQMHHGPNGTDRQTFSVATGNYVAGRSAGNENWI